MVHTLAGTDIGGKAEALAAASQFKRSQPYANQPASRAMLSVPAGRNCGLSNGQLRWPVLELADDNDNVGWVSDDNLVASQ